MILRTEKLSKRFNGLEAVSGVDFSLEQGQFKSIIGPNGAGKTTFFNLLAGVLMADSGRIIFQGKEITNRPQEKIARLGMVKTNQTAQVFPGHTVLENLRIAAQPPASSFNFWSSGRCLKKSDQWAGEVLHRLGLEHAAHKKAKFLSHGERRYLDIGLALAVRPRVLLLDEPTAGMSPPETAQATRLLKNLTSQWGLSVILVEHDMDVVMNISDQVVVMHQGGVFAKGAPEEISRNPAVQEVYLGRKKALC
jgi:branched-chain amino acid transport system ATP-binding protein